MVARPRIEWNMAGFRALRTDPTIAADIQARAERIASTAGDGHEVKASTTGGRGRARATVTTTTFESRKAEAEDMNLTRSIDAGR